VLVDGRLVNSCLMLALDAIGAEVTTVEGLATNGRLDPIQEAFVKHDALQCGYCTPGLVVACRALLNEHPRPTLDQIKRGLSGNICRCGTYTNIFNAVLEASGQSPIIDQKGA
jgi:aerobic-type carbon monoxide dehydrogenase small subunit (CoxS/CutS family)